MTSTKLISTVVYLFLVCSITCSVNAKEQNILVGSIPGDAIAKQMLRIDSSENVDFIRLRIALNEGDRKFDLSSAYGIGKPNTRDFDNGGKSMSAKGILEIGDKGGYLVYRIFNPEAGIELSLIRLNDSIFHVLSPNGRMLAGNGGWNYTLSRESDPKSKPDLKLHAKRPDNTNDPDSVIFAGRTPCIEIARELNIAVTDDCFKLKWKLTLNRDPSTKAPTTFVLQRTFRRPEPLEGKWQIVNGAGAVVYRLEGTDGSTMSLLRLDDSLLFLDKAGRLMKGNSEFGYTLDRQRDDKPKDLEKAKME